MKVFWSWQSDTPGKIGRHFVRDVLRQAITELRQEPDITESARQDLHLDHDRQGLTGSPDIAREIYKKIQVAAVFVADVTLVGTPDLGDGRHKRVINSNVAIELGYAAGTIGDARILMVQNTFFGDRDDLPFDLRGKGGPIQFHLPPDCSQGDRDQAGHGLKGELKTALRAYVQQAPSTNKAPKLDRQTWSRDSLHFDGSDRLDVLAIEGAPRRTVRVDMERGVYLRFLPDTALAARLTSARCLEVVQAQRLAVLDHSIAPGQPARNPNGAATYRLRSPESKIASTVIQLFPTGEMWAVSETFFVGRDPVFDISGLADPLLRVLRSCHVTYLQELEGAEAVSIEIGAVGLRGLNCNLGRGRVVGPFYRDTVSIQGRLNWFDGDVEREELAQSFVRQVAEEAGERIPGWQLKETQR